TVGDRAATQSATLALRALVAQAGTHTNTATAASPVPDPNQPNNTGSADVEAVRRADLAITKTDDAVAVVAGTSTTYTITVTNAGPTAVEGAGVTDAFPAALTGVTWTCSAGPGG